MKCKSMLMIGIAMVWLSVLGGLVISAQDKYTVRVPGGLAFSEFRGYESWQSISIAARRRDAPQNRPIRQKGRPRGLGRERPSSGTACAHPDGPSAKGIGVVAIDLTDVMLVDREAGDASVAQRAEGTRA